MMRWDLKTFRRTWFTSADESDGFAKKRIRNADNVSFPASFSKSVPDRDGDVIMYLALCRVIVDGSKRDSGAYIIDKRNHVLPEFIVQYRNAAADMPVRTHAASPLHSDLSVSKNRRLMQYLDDVISSKITSGMDTCEISWSRSANAPGILDPDKMKKIREAESLSDWAVVRKNAKRQRDNLLRYVNILAHCGGNSRLRIAKKKNEELLGLIEMAREELASESATTKKLLLK